MKDKGEALTKYGDENKDPVERSDLFRLVTGESWSRLEITVANSPISLIREVLKTWRAPFALVYELLVTRNALWAEGRYQSEWMQDFGELDALLVEYGDFFERDGRHNIWLADFRAPRQIVYDRHEIIFIYGAEASLVETLRERGFSEGAPAAPVPHAHFYHFQFDDAFDALMTSRAWNYSKP